MAISCIIIDDEPLARKLLADYAGKTSLLNLAGTFANPLLASETIRLQQIDLLFLDIQMPEITGLSFLRTLVKKPLVIITTAYSEYAMEGYELDVVDYLLKPIIFERFLKAVEKANARIVSGSNEASPAATEEFIFVKDGTKLVKINLGEILYIEGLKDYVTIHTKNQKITSLQRMKMLEDQLPPRQFIRIHNSYIISINAISTVHKNSVELGDTTLPIGETYRKAFRALIDKNFL